tara:strand:+ start:612 stop:1082 length:471 start_codon:yes stop_codon:yes gene_type:complete
MFNIFELLFLEFIIISLLLIISVISKKNLIKYLFFLPLIFNLLIFFIENRHIEFLFFNLSFSFIFLEFYSLITRGFSISLILTIKNNPFNNTKKKLITNYAEKGLDWLTANRIEGLVKIKFVTIKNKKYYITKGLSLFIFNFLLFLKKFYNLQKIK